MTTLTSYVTAHLRERRKRGEITQGTAKNARYCLDSLDVSFGDRPLDQLTRRAIERWLEQIGHLAPSTRRNHLVAARTFCNWLVDRGLLSENPTLKVAKIRQPRSVPRALPHTDAVRLYQSLPDARARAIISLMVGCGLRCVEVSRLTVSDYDPDAGTLFVTGKAGHERVVPVPGEVGPILDTYLSGIGGVRSGPLIRSTVRPHAGLSRETISTYVSRWMEAAGIKDGHWDGRSAHALRHTAASDVLDLSGDLRLVQAMLGHQHLSSTAIYLRRAKLDQLRAAMEGRDYTGHPPSLRIVA